MSQMTVEQFANELGVLPTILLEQLQTAGVRKHLTGDSLTEKDKTQLLEYLQKIHGSRGEKSKISLPPRRQTSEIKKSDSTGRPRSIQVEVRKKQVLVKDDSSDKPRIEDVQHLRQEEARKQAELVPPQTAELKERLRRKAVDSGKPRNPISSPPPSIRRNQVAAIRLEEAFTSAAMGDGRCAGCSLTASLKLATTNHGLLALCAECLRKGLKRYKKWIVLQRTSLRKKKRRGRYFVRILQGGAPGLGKRSS
jgi:translation initiation factor IF-2